MALNYLTDIKPLEDAGQTDAQIATLFSAQTATDMPNLPLRKYLHKNNLWLVDPATNLWLGGSIGESYSTLTTPQKALLQKLWIWIYEQDSIETENDLDVAVEFKTIIDGIVALSIIDSQIRIDIGAIAGGLKHGILTAQDIADHRTVYQNSEAETVRQNTIDSLRAEIENTWINPAITDGVSDAATVRAAIKAGL